MENPIFLAGMNVAAGPELCAAVSNAGGLGSIGGVGFTPAFLRKQIKEIKSLIQPNKPFGIDLLIPQIGANARPTNYDYTDGNLAELIDIIISSGATLFICAVGVPPKCLFIALLIPGCVEKLHKAGIFVMNMVGAPKHAIKAMEAGCGILCAQGGEGGGHTGEIPTSILVPALTSPLTGDPIYVVAAGGIFDCRGLAMALAMGAQGVWVGTRFVASSEAGAPPAHQQAILECGFNDTIRTSIFTGRPLRVIKNSYIMNWETNRRAEMDKLLKKGVIPYKVDADKSSPDIKLLLAARPYLMGKVAAVIHDVKPAKEIMDEMIAGAIKILKSNIDCIVPLQAIRSRI